MRAAHLARINRTSCRLYQLTTRLNHFSMAGISASAASAKPSVVREGEAAKAIIAPSMLSSDFANLSSEAKRMIDCGADWLHMDVMDGHFVPNLTIGHPVIKALRAHFPRGKGEKPAYLDCHLMVSEPRKWVEQFAAAGADGFTFHWETCSGADDAAELCRQIRRLGMRPGVAIKPGTAIEDVMPLLEQTYTLRELEEEASKRSEKVAVEERALWGAGGGSRTESSGEGESKVGAGGAGEERRPLVGLALVMTVEPGFGGQSFMSDQMGKVSAIRGKCPGMHIQVDGGIKAGETAEAVGKAGANVIVSGTGVFKAESPAGAIEAIRAAVDGAV